MTTTCTFDTIDIAIEALKKGGVVIYPTDTAYGIGCRIDNPRSVDRVLAIKQRPSTQAVPVLVSSIDMALPYFKNPSDIVRRLQTSYWPGGLTIVSETYTDMLYSPIRGNGTTIGLRMPNHPVSLRLISGLGVPILGPSANIHGKPTPYSYADLDPQLVLCVDCVVVGECLHHEASTVVDCTEKPYRIIRQGAVILPKS